MPGAGVVDMRFVAVVMHGVGVVDMRFGVVVVPVVACDSTKEIEAMTIKMGMHILVSYRGRKTSMLWASRSCTWPVPDSLSIACR